MKFKKIAVFMMAMMLAAGTAYAQEGGTAQTEEMAVETQTGQVAESAADSSAGSGTGLADAKWSDYMLQIDDEVYRFPMMYEEFTAYGWVNDDEEIPQLEPNQYDMLYFSKDGVKCTAYVVNLGKNDEQADKCIIGGMSIDDMDWEESDKTVTLPGGITKGQSDAAAIEAAYGQPSDTYEGSMYKQLTYETDSYSYIELTVGNESGVLEDIQVRNFVEPEGFDAGEISTEVPAAVTSYVKPEELGDNLDDFRISMDGEVYALPVPVSTLIADGWEMDAQETDAEIDAHSFGWVTLRKGGLEIREITVNEEGYATVPENCWLESLTVGGYTLELDGALPGGITTGMPESELLALLDGAGVPYESETSGDFSYYTVNEKDYGKSYELIVYKGDDGHFGKDTVMEVSCSNVFE